MLGSLPCKHEDLSSNPLHPPQKKKKKATVLGTGGKASGRQQGHQELLATADLQVVREQVSRD